MSLNRDRRQPSSWEKLLYRAGASRPDDAALTRVWQRAAAAFRAGKAGPRVTGHGERGPGGTVDGQNGGSS